MRLPKFHSLRPASGSAEQGLLVGTQREHVCTAYMQIYAAGYANDLHSTHTNTGSTSGLILLPALAEWNGRPLMRTSIPMCVRVSACVNISIYTHKGIDTHTHVYTHLLKCLLGNGKAT